MLQWKCIRKKPLSEDHTVYNQVKHYSKNLKANICLLTLGTRLLLWFWSITLFGLFLCTIFFNLLNVSTLLPFLFCFTAELWRWLFFILISYPNLHNNPSKVYLLICIETSWMALNICLSFHYSMINRWCVGSVMVTGM